MGSVQITYQNKRFDELSPEDQSLIKCAKQAMDNAYAPYSGFSVGCAVKMANQEIVTGNNQENAAYPSGLCAERVALFGVKSKTRASIDTLVVVARSKNGQDANAFSCGNCRQVMTEYAHQQTAPIRILMQTDQSTFIEVDNVKELLPFHFNSDSLQ
jgi:cytidine deaminase